MASNNLINPIDIGNSSAVIDVEITSNELQLAIQTMLAQKCLTIAIFLLLHACVHLSHVWFLNFVINSSLLFISNFGLNISGITYIFAGAEHPDSRGTVGFHK